MNNVQDSSGYRRYCIGIVALDKKLHENTIEAMPLETAALLDGELTDKWDEITIDGLDGEIIPYTNKAKFTKTIQCTWIAMHQPNRMTSPDVRRGDKVQIYRLGDSNIFYWDTLDNYGKTRRLETVVNGYSAIKDEDVTLSPDNTYVQGVSTHEKLVTIIHTSKHPSNGEKYKYAIFVDTKNNHIVIKDDQGNRIVLQTDPSLIRLETKENGFIQIDKTRITSKGQWYHKGSLSVDGGVWDQNVNLASHTHPKVPPPNRTSMPWSPHADSIKIDYRSPELLK